jgi:hypothetical protein
VVDEATATPVYLKAVKGAEPLTPGEQKLLEDYLFGAIAAAAGAQQLVVQIHTGNGDGPFFNNGNANPALLENALNSRPLRKTSFVLLHGGWPYHALAQAMMDKPNTWVDFSAQTFYLGTHQLAEVLREWLSWHPEKVLFGTDAYSDVDSPLSDWEEKEVLLAGKSRRALAIALTAMMQNNEITRERALEIARLVLRENAMKLYGLAPNVAAGAPARSESAARADSPAARRRRVPRVVSWAFGLPVFSSIMALGTGARAAAAPAARWCSTTRRSSTSWCSSSCSRHFSSGSCTCAAGRWRKSGLAISWRGTGWVAAAGRDLRAAPWGRRHWRTCSCRWRCRRRGGCIPPPIRR